MIAQAAVSDLIVYGQSDCAFARFLAKPKEQEQAGQELISGRFKSDSDDLVRQYAFRIAIEASRIVLIHAGTGAKGA